MLGGVIVCGIAGLLLPRPGPIGAYLTDMIAAEQHRGPDSTGFALYSAESDGCRVCGRIADARDASAVTEHIASATSAIGARIIDGVDITSEKRGGLDDQFFQVVISDVQDTQELLARLEEYAGLEVHSIGANLVLVKDVGDAHTVANRHGLRDFQGTHGLAHCRLATESIVDVAHSHPFWGRPSPDIAVVHNGQITNYWKLRDVLERAGYEFATDNDSELIAIYVAARLSEGSTLDDALHSSIDDFDGCFTYLVSTVDSIGMAKDRLAAKPFVIAERDDLVAMASEEGALMAIFGVEFESSRPHEGEVMTWSSLTLKS